MNVLDVGLSGLLLAVSASASAMTVYKSELPASNVDYEFCYQYILDEKENSSEQVSFQSTNAITQSQRSCADLFESMYNDLQEMAKDYDKPSFFSKEYYDFLLDDKVIATIKQKLGQPEAVTTPSTVTGSGAETAYLNIESGKNSGEKEYTDAQIEALIVNLAHTLMTNYRSRSHSFCSGPYLNKSSYLGCNAVMAKYFLMDDSELKYLVLKPGVDFEKVTNNWVMNNDTNPPTFLVVDGHVNAFKSWYLSEFEGIVGIPDVIGDHFDPFKPLEHGERSKIGIYHDFKTYCESEEPDQLKFMSCGATNSMMFGFNPNISGVDIEVTLSKIQRSYKYIDSAGATGEGSYGNPAYVLAGDSSGSASIINSRINLKIAPEKTINIDKVFDYQLLPPVKEPKYDVFLFDSPAVNSFIFSKTIVTLDSCDSSYGGVHRVVQNNAAPRIYAGNLVQNIHGDECLDPSISTTTDNVITKPTASTHNHASSTTPALALLTTMLMGVVAAQ